MTSTHQYPEPNPDDMRPVELREEVWSLRTALALTRTSRETNYRRVQALRPVAWAARDLVAAIEAGGFTATALDDLRTALAEADHAAGQRQPRTTITPPEETP